MNYLDNGYKKGFFDGWIPCYFKNDEEGGVEIIGRNRFFDILIEIWSPIAGLNPNGFMIKFKDKK